MTEKRDTIPVDASGIEKAARDIEKVREQLARRAQPVRERARASDGTPGAFKSGGKANKAADVLQSIRTGTALIRAGLVGQITELVEKGLEFAQKRAAGSTVREIVKESLPNLLDSAPVIGRIRAIAREEDQRARLRILGELEDREAEKDLESKLSTQASLRREAAQQATEELKASWKFRRIRREASLSGLG